MEIDVKKHSLLIEDEDLEKVSDLILRVASNNGRPICKYYIKNDRTKQRLYRSLHQIILGPKPKKYVAFFKDGNRLNPRKDNVSYIPRKIFSYIVSSGIPRKNTFRGVVKVFTARIKHNSKIKFMTWEH